MGLLERVAVSDLKLRLVVGPAVVVFAASLFAGVQLLGGVGGAVAGAAVGLALAGVVAYAVAGKLFSTVRERE